MQWIGEAQISRTVCERRFDLTVDDQIVPGILWMPEEAHGARPLVLIGHGGSQHKRSPNVLAIGRRIVRHLGYAACAIDGPTHGDRAPDGDQPTLDDVRQRMNEDPELTATRFRAARKEWSATIDALRELDEVGSGPVGYWGLSLGTVIGLPFVASEPRIDCAVLGLLGVPAGAQPRSATSLRIPVLFLAQLHDELVPIANAVNLFDLIGSKDKTMHVNPGLHAAVPAEEIKASEAFFAKHLGAKVLTTT